MLNRLTGRRAMMVGDAGVAAGYLRSMGIAEETQTQRGPVLLSDQGRGRVTASVEANRIVTLRGHTHATRLDSEADDFRIHARTLDREAELWLPMYTSGAFCHHFKPSYSKTGRR